MKIFLNPGHALNGIPDKGAVNIERGAFEHEIAANVAKMVDNLLTGAGYEVMTYQNNSLEEIVDVANNWGADYFVSIHVNDYIDHNANGTETYCFDTLSVGGELADSIQDRIVCQLGMANRGTKEANYYVIRWTCMPAVLVELGFINSKDVDKLLNRQEDFAKAIYEGIVDFLEEE